MRIFFLFSHPGKHFVNFSFKPNLLMFVKSVIIPNFFSTAYILRKIALLSLTGDIICITKQLWSHITSHESAKSATGSWRSSGHLFSRDLDVWKQIRMKRLFGKNMESYQRECPKRWRVFGIQQFTSCLEICQTNLFPTFKSKSPKWPSSPLKFQLCSR